MFIIIRDSHVKGIDPSQEDTELNIPSGLRIGTGGRSRDRALKRSEGKSRWGEEPRAAGGQVGLGTEQMVAGRVRPL